MSKTKNIKEIHIPKAENTRMDTNNKLVINWLDKIEKTKRDGRTSCHVSGGLSGVSKYAIQRFIDEGYDFHYNYFIDDGLWFVTVHWEDGCCGRIYSKEDGRYVDIDEMFIY